MGHDQLFKQLLQAFFADFLRLFDPNTAAHVDLSTISFRDTEAFTDIPQGQRRVADMVAQVETLDGNPGLVLIHVEIQREREDDFAWRMWQYFVLLRQRENLPVIPIAVVFYTADEGIAIDTYEEAIFGQTIVTFRYLRISLPMLPAERYIGAESPLGAGLASVMRPLGKGRMARTELHLACLRRVRMAQEAGEIDEARAFLLINVVATYLPLSDDERDALRVQLRQEGDITLEVTELTWADQIFLRGQTEGRTEGRAEGRTEGRAEGRTEGRAEGAVLTLRDNIRQVLRSRFGAVPAPVEAALVGMEREEDLAALFRRSLDVPSVDDLL